MTSRRCGHHTPHCLQTPEDMDTVLMLRLRRLFLDTLYPVSQHQQRYVSLTWIYHMPALRHDGTATILSKIVQSIYSIRNNASRHAESTHLEGWLDKWYLDLPEHLRFGVRYDATGNLVMMDGRIPPPHILTLHMQYWCTTLLLHRPL